MIIFVKPDTLVGAAVEEAGSEVEVVVVVVVVAVVVVVVNIAAVVEVVVGAEVVEIVVNCVVTIVVVVTSPQFEGSFSRGGLLGPDLHPGQGFLSGGQAEWRRHPLGEDE